MTPPTQHSTRSRPRPITLAAAAAMTGLLVLTQPGAAIAAEKAGAADTEKTVLHPTISGTGGSVRYSIASLAGGGVQLSFVLVPNEAAGEKSGRDETQSREFAVTVDAAAVATETVTDDGGTVVPAADDTSDDDSADKEADEDGGSTKPPASRDTGAIVEQDVSDGSTQVTLSADTEGVATVWVLPQQAPAAADPDDQNWVTRTWHLLVDKITGDSDDSSEEDNDQGDSTDAEPTAEPTSSPTSSPTSDPTSSSSTPTPSSSSSSSSNTTTSGADQDEDATGEGDTCVVTQDQLTVSTRDGGDGTVDAPLEDGPSAAPTFSEEVRKKAAQQQEQGSECGEGSTDDATDDDSDKPDGADVTEVADTSSSSGSSSGGSKVEVAAGDWLSGISGERPAAEKLRGVPAEVATTWTDFSGNADQLNPGAEFGPDKWDKSLIIAMPPFPQGSSWEATAAGDNDEYLRHAFSTLKSKWAGRDGTAYIEYSYEANGYWMAWPVKAGQEDAWAKAFERARSIQQDEFPDARLGVRLNHESNGYDGDSHDLLQAVKGSIDFIGTSYYNAYPPVATPKSSSSGPRCSTAAAVRRASRLGWLRRRRSACRSSSGSGPRARRTATVRRSLTGCTTRSPATQGPVLGRCSPRATSTWSRTATTGGSTRARSPSPRSGTPRSSATSAETSPR